MRFATADNSNHFVIDKDKGSVYFSGELQKPAKTGEANLAPIAYGSIASNATINTGTGNFTCVWNQTYSGYLITINGESYSSNGYITLVTPISYGHEVRAGGQSNDLLVMIYNSSGSSVQSSFQFVTYKP